VKQELFAHFVMITLSRLFANQTDDILLLKQNIKKQNNQNPIQSNFKNVLTTLARNLQALLLRQVEYVKDLISTIIHSIATCYQKVRPSRSYEHLSHKVPNKWRPNKKKKLVTALT
jgi:hypothetical protein